MNGTPTLVYYSIIKKIYIYILAFKMEAYSNYTGLYVNINAIGWWWWCFKTKVKKSRIFFGLCSF